MNSKVPCALTIAGSDPCAGAGVQADLKTFTTLKVYGQSVITSLTAQNTLGVRSIHDLPADFIEDQFDAVMEDIKCDAVKIGMLSNVDIVSSISRKLDQYKIARSVLDPVMVSASGSKLLENKAVSELIYKLIPQCYIVTPNIPEAEMITGMTINDLTSMKQASKAIKDLGCDFVLLKGGHLESSELSTDVFFDGDKFREYETKRIKISSVHGTGCTLSSAVCAYLAKDHELEDAIEHAKNYVFQAINNRFNIGKGSPLLNHNWGMDKIE